MGEWLNKLWYIPTMEYCSEIFLKDKLLLHATAWMNLQTIMLSEKKANLKGCIWYDSTYITFLK